MTKKRMTALSFVTIALAIVFAFGLVLMNAPTSAVASAARPDNFDILVVNGVEHTLYDKLEFPYSGAAIDTSVIQFKDRDELEENRVVTSMEFFEDEFCESPVADSTAIGDYWVKLYVEGDASEWAIVPLSIVRVPLTIDWEDAALKAKLECEYGEAPSLIEASDLVVSGYLAGEEEGITLSVRYLTKGSSPQEFTPSQSTNAGEYTVEVSISGEHAGHYAISNAQSTFKVKKRVIRIVEWRWNGHATLAHTGNSLPYTGSPMDVSAVVEGDVTPSLAYVWTTGDEFETDEFGYESILNETSYNDDMLTAGSAVNVNAEHHYYVYANIAAADQVNYEWSNEVEDQNLRFCQFDVVKRHLQVEWGSLELGYTDAAQMPSYTLTPVAVTNETEDDLSAVLIPSAENGGLAEEGKHSAMGTYDGDAEAENSRASITLADPDNYALDGDSAVNYTIGKADFDATVSLEGWTYGETANEPSVSANPGSGAVTYSYKTSTDQALDSKPVNAGSYKVVATIAETDFYKGKVLEASFTIAKKELTVTAENKIVSYGEDVSLTWTVTGFANEETRKSVLGDKAPLLSTAYAAGSPCNGETGYAIEITAGSLAADNYTFTLVPGKITVQKRAITVTIGNVTDAIYGTVKTLPYEITARTIASTDQESEVFTVGVTGLNEHTEVGTYLIRLSDGAKADNYAITVVADYEEDATPVGRYEIAPRKVTYVKKLGSLQEKEYQYDTADSIVYDGTEKSFKLELTNKVAGDDLALLLSATKEGAGSATQSGTAKGDYEYYVILSGEDAGNYFFDEEEGQVTFRITAAEATVTAAPALVDEDLTYNGSEQDLLKSLGSASGGTLTFLVQAPGEEKGSYDDGITTMPKGLAAGTYTVYYKAVADANHSDSAEGSLEISIAKKAITVTAEDKESVYGEELETLTATVVDTATKEVCVLPDEEHLVYTLTKAEGSDADDYKITVVPAENGNYEVTAVSGTYTIKQRPIRYRIDDKGSVYGDELAAFGVTLVTNEEGKYSVPENETPLFDLTAYEKISEEVKLGTTSPAGQYPIVGADNDPNYDIYFYQGTYTISPRPITVTYTGEHKEITFAHREAYWNLGKEMEENGWYLEVKEGKLVNKDTLAGVISYDLEGVDEEILDRFMTPAAGRYELAVWEVDSNYSVTVDLGKEAYLLVKKAVITVTPDARQGKTYGDADQPLTYQATTKGYTRDEDGKQIRVDEEMPEELKEILLVGALGREAGENAGSYAITMGTLALANAEEITISDDFILNAFEEMIREIYEDTLSEMSEEEAAVFVSAELAKITEETIENYRKLLIVQAQAIVNNCELVFVNAVTYTIAPKPITVTYTGEHKEITFAHREAYWNLGKEMEENGWYLNGQTVKGDNLFEVIECELEGLDESVAEELGTPYAGRYALIVRGINGNYTVTADLGDEAYLLIKKAVITVTPDARQGKTYGDADRTITYQATAEGYALDEEGRQVRRNEAMPESQKGILLVGALGRAAGENAGSYAITMGSLAFVKAEEITISDDFILNALEERIRELYEDTLSEMSEEDAAAFVSAALAKIPAEAIAAYRAQALFEAQAVVNNCEIAFVNTVSYTIAPKPITVTYAGEHKEITFADAQGNYAFGEEMDANDWYLEAQTANGDDLFDVITCYVDRIDETAGEYFGTPYAGKYDIVVLGINDNYTVTADLGEEAYLLVKKAVITVTPDADQSKTYGEADRELTYKVTMPRSVIEEGVFREEVYEFNRDERLSFLSGKLSREEGETVGTYEITQGDVAFFASSAFTLFPEPVFSMMFPNKEDRELMIYKAAYFGGIVNNCELVFTAGVTYAINKKAVNVVAEDKSSYCKEDLAALTYTADGILDKDDRDAIVGISCEADAAKPGKYAIVLTDKGNANYDLHLTNGTYTVMEVKVEPTPVEGSEEIEANTYKEITEEEVKESGVSIKEVIESVTALLESEEATTGKVELNIGEATEVEDEEGNKTKVYETTITFDAGALKQLAQNEDVVIKFEKTKAEDVDAAEKPALKDAKLVLEISLGGAAFDEGSATISTDFVNEAPKGTKAVVFYVAEDGTKTDMKATFEGGKVTFVTTHFSTYVIEYVSLGEESGSPIAVIAPIVIGGIVLVGACAYLLFRSRRKKGGEPSEEDAATEEGKVQEGKKEE